jgi:hypothetical protein
MGLKADREYVRKLQAKPRWQHELVHGFYFMLAILIVGSILVLGFLLGEPVFNPGKPTP